MRSLNPDPSNPWPSDMTITVKNGSSSIAFLLFVRSAWRIEGVDLPGLDPEPAVGQSRRPRGVDDEALLDEWRTAWSDVIEGMVRERSRVPRPVDDAARALVDATSFEELQALLNPKDPRLTPLFSTGVDIEAFAEWNRVGTSRLLGRIVEHPERVNLRELVPAWRDGLDTITELPFADHWARRIGRSHLLVAARTRADRREYGRALSLPFGSA